MKLIVRSILIAFLCLGAAIPHRTLAQGLTVDPATPEYVTTGQLSGTITSAGSDTMARIMYAWADAFQGYHRDVTVFSESKGSGTAPAALMDGSAQMGPMSRRMSAAEVEAFRKKFGYEPTEIKVALDALCVFVNKANPIGGLTMAQVRGIFAEVPGATEPPITNWGQLGLKGEWADRPIVIFGRNGSSGTHAFFGEAVLKKRAFRDSIHERAGSGLVVKEVGWEPAAIGYAGVGFRSNTTKILPVGSSPAELVEPTAENALNGTYPLSRFLYIYVNKRPGRPLDHLTAEFLRFIASKEGQEAVVDEGFFALPATTCADQIAQLK